MATLLFALTLGCNSCREDFLDFAKLEAKKEGFKRVVVQGFSENTASAKRIWIRGPIEKRLLLGALQCDEVEDLGISHQNISEEHCRIISEMSNLKSLTIASCSIKRCYLLCLLRGRSLEKCKLIDNIFEDRLNAAAEALAVSDKLVELEVGCTPRLSSEELEVVINSASLLRSLRISGSLAGPSTLIRLSQCRELRYLDVSYTSANSDCIVRWANLNHLVSLECRGCKLSDIDLLPLLEYPALNRVDLRDVSVTDNRFLELLSKSRSVLCRNARSVKSPHTIRKAND